ncbi:MAG: glycosyltransferase family 2 protein [Bacteroidota bacterium]|nr:glycosyltransferase family 2 protein [Bacteroidota bacterium]
MKKIAILLTCHNRKEKTINCLKSLHQALESSDHKIKFDIYLVDDGSTDGTSEQVSLHFPEINLIKGSGELFWAGGMRLAWKTALTKDPHYDSFLLLNDDVMLMENFLIELLSTHEYCLEHYNRPGIYVSSTRDLINSKISYGGTLIKHKGIKLKSVRINPGDVPLPCSMANANILMVTMDVVKAIGILDPTYTHQFADYDYSLTAAKKGIPVLVCPGVGGKCMNDHEKSWLSADTSLKDRISYLYSPLGLAYKEQIYYLKKNFKYQLPYYFIMLWLKTLFPFIWDEFKKNPGQTTI